MMPRPPWSTSTAGGVGVSLPSAQRSRYVQLFAGDPGVDPYTRVVSDVYQDLFGEGSFIGKGIYDVDAVERVLKGRFPANRILSHDLLEGIFARSGLASDVEVFDEFPVRFDVAAARQHRAGHRLAQHAEAAGDRKGSRGHGAS